MFLDVLRWLQSADVVLYLSFTYKQHLHFPEYYSSYVNIYYKLYTFHKSVSVGLYFFIAWPLEI